MELKIRDAAHLAKMLNGGEYSKEITPEIEMAARVGGLVVVFGASDDLCEFRGALREELASDNGGRFVWMGREFILDRWNTIEDDCIYIKQTWDPDHIDASWSFETNIPGAEKFLIYEDRGRSSQIYGEGLVFSYDKVKDLDGVYPVKSALEQVYRLSSLQDSFEEDELRDVMGKITDLASDALKQIGGTRGR